MAKTRGRVRKQTTTTEKHLFATQPYCAYPECDIKTVDTNHRPPIIVAEIAHILPASASGPRSDPSLDYDDPAVVEHLRSFENLVLLCGTHHTLADSDPKYTADILRDWKERATATSADSVPDRPLPPWMVQLGIFLTASLGAASIIGLVPGGTTHRWWLLGCSIVIGLGTTALRLVLTQPTRRHQRPPSHVLAAGAALIILTGLTVAFVGAPNAETQALPGTASTNVAVFDLEGNDAGTSDELVSRLEAGLDSSRLDKEGWKAGGPFSGSLSSGSDAAISSRLTKVNAGLGIFGTVDDGALQSLSVWVTPTMEGSDFFAALGPVPLVEQFPNVSAAGRLTIAEEQVVNFVELAQALSQIHNAFGVCDEAGLCDATDDEALDSASDRLLALIHTSGRSRTAVYETQQLARLSLSQVSISRLARPGADGELREELIEVARRYLTEALDAAKDQSDALTEFRATLGTNALLIATEQCDVGSDVEAGVELLRIARAQLDDLSDAQRVQAEVRLEHADAKLSWCRWRAGQLPLESAMDTHNRAIEALRADSTAYFDDLQAHLLADALVQRAELRAGDDSAGCSSDLAEGLELAPAIAGPVYQDQTEEFSCDS